MDISSIYKSLRNFIDENTRKPFPALSSILMICSLMKRPGLSTIVSTSNILMACQCDGINIDDLPDGSMNLLKPYTKNVVDEVFRALREDANIKTYIRDGSINIATPYGVYTNVATPPQSAACT